MKLTRLCSLVTAIALAFAGSANADIALTGSGTGSNEFNNQNGNTVGFTESGVSLSGGNAIAVLLSSESVDAYGVTFGGEALLLGEHGENSGSSGAGAPQDVSIFYLINPTASTGDLVISGTSTTDNDAGFAYSYVTLSGVTGVGTWDEAHGGSNAGNVTLEHTTAFDGGFAVFSAVNNASNLGNTPSYVSGLASNELQRTYLSAGGSGHLHHYGALPTAGTFGETVSLTNSRDAFAVVAFESVPVPEPGSASVLVLAALGFLVRRRKS